MRVWEADGQIRARSVRCHPSNSHSISYPNIPATAYNTPMHAPTLRILFSFVLDLPKLFLFRSGLLVAFHSAAGQHEVRGAIHRAVCPTNHASQAAICSVRWAVARSRRGSISICRRSACAHTASLVTCTPGALCVRYRVLEPRLQALEYGRAAVGAQGVEARACAETIRVGA